MKRPAPEFAARDLWETLGLADDFDTHYAENGWDGTWRLLLDTVRNLVEMRGVGWAYTGEVSVGPTGQHPSRPGDPFKTYPTPPAPPPPGSES